MSRFQTIFMKKKILLKIELQHWTVTINNNKYQQGGLNISEDIKIKTNIKQKYLNIIDFLMYCIHSDKNLRKET